MFPFLAMQVLQLVPPGPWDEIDDSLVMDWDWEEALSR
jgi:hypothetical protein